MKANDTKNLREKENQRLKKIVADLTITSLAGHIASGCGLCEWAKLDLGAILVMLRSMSATMSS